MVRIKHLLQILLVLVSISFSQAVCADVSVTFYSHDFDDHFPHAFFVANGDLSNGVVIDDAFGFTAKKISPTILLGSVKGHVSRPSIKYIQNSMMHFTVILDDKQYKNLKLVVEKWERIPGKSYNLKKRNCVHFTADILKALGLTINVNSKHFKKPKSFLREVTALNSDLKLRSSENQ